jgi:hypothetical protein
MHSKQGTDKGIWASNAKEHPSPEQLASMIIGHPTEG